MSLSQTLPYFTSYISISSSAVLLLSTLPHVIKQGRSPPTRRANGHISFPPCVHKKSWECYPQDLLILFNICHS